ncbi:unnamed protein product [Cylindrotheca closterium]|uniref:MalT-like TPR region domain-containing protein n=1 Tax=Cylindrotheca closterium TaxID=2856 RepID=A0AAD2FY55_9STRA|nr:unnamed protein product [Cylindrotheca closterium]
MNFNEGDSVEKFMEDYLRCFDKDSQYNAKKIVERILETQVETLGEDDPSLALALAFKGIMGRVFLQQDDGAEAEKVFRKILDINREMLPHHDSDLMDVYQSLALSLKMQDKSSEATKTQKFVLATLLKEHGEDHPGVVKTYIGIAGLLLEQDRWDDALQMLDECIEICSRPRRLGEFKGLLLSALHAKATSLLALRNCEDATELFAQLLMMHKETNGEFHPDTAEAYENLAVAYVQQEMLKDGIKAYTKAIGIRQSLLMSGDRHTKQLMETLESLKCATKAEELTNKGLAMKAQGNSEKAIQLFQMALDVYKGRFRTHPKWAAVYENISAVKVEQGLLEDGIAASAESLKMYRRAVGDDHPGTKKRMEEHRSLLKRLLENRS